MASAQAETLIRFARNSSDVQVREKQGDPWREARFGERLGPGASIRVGPEAECDLVVGEPGNNLRLQAGTVITIEALEPDGSLRMDDGGIYAELKKLKKKSSFQVISPTAIAAVRGTSWHQTLSRITVFEGQVLVSSAVAEGEPIELDPGLSVVVSDDGVIGEPGPAPPDEMEEWTEVEAEISEEVPGDDPGLDAGEKDQEKRNEG